VKRANNKVLSDDGLIHCSRAEQIGNISDNLLSYRWLSNFGAIIRLWKEKVFSYTRQITGYSESTCERYEGLANFLLRSGFWDETISYTEDAVDRSRIGEKPYNLVL